MIIRTTLWNNNFLPDELKNQSIWKVQDNPAEKKLGDWLRNLWKGRF